MVHFEKISKKRKGIIFYIENPAIQVFNIFKIKNMEETKLEKMKDIQIKLEDIYNSQASLIEKIAKVLTGLFNEPDAGLEKKLNELHTNASNNAERAKAVLDDYKLKVNNEANQ